MKELREIVEAYDQARQKGQDCVLATVVHVDGSSYRRPGARMLVTPDGQLTGAISGGCLEGDALRKALFVLTRRESMLVTYDTSDEDDAQLGARMGCNGIIQVLMEPVRREDAKNPVRLIAEAIEKREAAVLLSLFSLENKRDEQAGTCLVWKKDKFISRSKMAETWAEEAQKILDEKRSVFRHYISNTSNVHAFWEYIAPPVSLTVVGAGKDTVPLVEMAHILGWQTSIADTGMNQPRPDFYVPSCQFFSAKPEQLLQNVPTDARSAFVLLTHNYTLDLRMLTQLLKTDVAYIGCLGPKKKKERMIDEIQGSGTNLTDAQLNKIYGPVGLNIGAETPEEIALSILAEIQAVFEGKDGKSLRTNTTVIHTRAGTTFETVFMP